VIGAYHSHPRGPSEPSPSDLAGASEDPALMVIVLPAASRAAERVAAYLLRPDGFERVQLVRR